MAKYVGSTKRGDICDANTKSLALPHVRIWFRVTELSVVITNRTWCIVLISVVAFSSIKQIVRSRRLHIHWSSDALVERRSLADYAAAFETKGIVR